MNIFADRLDLYCSLYILPFVIGARFWEEYTSKDEQQEQQEEEEADETGIDPSDIALVQEQAQCSRNAAVMALRSNDMDIVDAIMELYS